MPKKPFGKKPDVSAGRALSVVLKPGKGRSASSQRWLTRQLNDPYVQAAHAAGWRSRAAFKLIELDERFGLLKRGARVLDLGAAPGGWSQVARNRGVGIVVAVDLLPIAPIPGVSFIEGDFTDPVVQTRLTAALGGPADLVLSDMAPNATGHAATDHLRIIALAEEAAAFALSILAPGGAFLAKVWQGGTERELLATLKKSFARVRHAKPPASRPESRELYVVAQGFRPPA